MISEFFINSVFENLKIMESENLKIKQNIKTENITQNEITKIKNKYDKDKELFSHLLSGKISDMDIYSFDGTKECKTLLKDIDNILFVMNNNILFDSNKINFNDIPKKNDIYNYLSYKIIKDNIKTLDLEYSLKDVNLFKNNDIGFLIKLLELKSENLLENSLIKKSMSDNKEKTNLNYSNNEIKVMSEISKYLIGDINNDEIEVMSPILISNLFSSINEEDSLLKAGYKSTDEFSQYLRGTQSINSVSETNTSNNNTTSYTKLVPVVVHTCHSSCHSSCHNSRGWR